LDGACSTNFKDEKYLRIFFLSKNLKGRAKYEELGVDGRIILEWV